MSANSESDTETSGRCFGQGPDTCLVAIGEGGDDLLQTKWLSTSAHNGPHESGLDRGAWYASYEKYGAELGRFIKGKACLRFLKGLREELGDG